MQSSTDIPICRPAAESEPLDQNRLLARAPAKLNLALHVGPIRPDRFHPLDSLVARVTLYDELTFATSPNPQITLDCDRPELGPPHDNLVFRAASALQSLAPSSGVHIRLRKNIPAGAGLGGGSSDAATTLKTLNQLWNLRLPPARLAEIALTLGSDVPLFLGPPVARMQGRGEILTPAAIKPFAAILICPPVHSPTGPVYQNFDSTAPESLRPLDLTPLNDLRPSLWPPHLHNDLYLPACRVSPDIALYADALARQLDRPVHMSGSGSALFVLADDLTSAAVLATALADSTPLVTSALPPLIQVVQLNPW